MQLQVFCGMLARIAQFADVLRDSREQLRQARRPPCITHISIQGTDPMLFVVICLIEAEGSCPAAFFAAFYRPEPHHPCSAELSVLQLWTSAWIPGRPCTEPPAVHPQPYRECATRPSWAT